MSFSEISLPKTELNGSPESFVPSDIGFRRPENIEAIPGSETGNRTYVERNTAGTDDLRRPSDTRPGIPGEGYRPIGRTIGEPVYVDGRHKETVEDPEKFDTNAVHEPNTRYEVGEHIYETDDKGHVYKDGKELLPNTEYEVNGYKYKTDDKGRIVSAEGNLRVKDREGRKTINEDMQDIGKGDQKDGDDKGHLIGDQFDGSNKLENLVPMSSDLNRGDFKALENDLAKEVKNGKNVYIKEQPVYEGNSRRPTKFIVTYEIDGKKEIRVFSNKEANSNGK